jgi:signal peptidase I
MEQSPMSWRKTIWGQIVELILLLGFVFLIRTFCFGLYQVPSGSMETTMLVGERFFADKLSYWFRDPARGEIIACNAPTFTYSKHPVKKLIEKYIWGPENWTKRIIGIPGDHVRGVIENGKPIVYLNNKILDEPYLNHNPLVHEYQYNAWNCDKEMCLKTYDPAKSFDQQPFYVINPKHLLRYTTGEIVLEYHDHARKSPVPVPADNHRFWGNNADEFDVQLGDDEYWLMGDNRRGSGDSRTFGPVKREIFHGRIVFRIWSIDSYEAWWIKDLIKHPIDFWPRIRWNRFWQRVY